MIATILLFIFFIIFGVALFIVFSKQTEAMSKSFNEQMDKSRELTQNLSEMVMAGSYENWLRIKSGLQPEPNQVEEAPNEVEITEDQKIPLDEVLKVSVDGEPAKNIKVYR